MPRVGFEPTITASERAKTVHALDRSATVTGQKHACSYIIYCQQHTLWYLVRISTKVQAILRVFNVIFTVFKEITECLETDHDRFLPHPNLTITNICAE
jgi:hypothetical protein